MAGEREPRAWLPRLWDRWRELDPKLDTFAARRSGETAVVILEPVD